MKPIYSQDKTAPRMKKGKYSTSVITNQLWNELREKHPDFKGKSNQDLNKLWNDMAETIRQETVSNPLGVKLGSYTGELKLQYLPYKFKAEDRGTSSEEGQRINHTNLITKGKVAKLKWERRWAVRFNKMLQYFAFGPTRELAKMAEQHIKAHPESVRTARVTLGGNGWKK